MGKRMFWKFLILFLIKVILIASPVDNGVNSGIEWLKFNQIPDTIPKSMHLPLHLNVSTMTKFKNVSWLDINENRYYVQVYNWSKEVEEGIWGYYKIHPKIKQYMTKIEFPLILANFPLEFSYRLLNYLSTGISLSMAIEKLSSKYPNLISKLTPVYTGNMNMILGDDEPCLEK